MISVRWYQICHLQNLVFSILTYKKFLKISVSYRYSHMSIHLNHLSTFPALEINNTVGKLPISATSTEAVANLRPYQSWCWKTPLPISSTSHPLLLFLPMVTMVFRNQYKSGVNYQWSNCCGNAGVLKQSINSISGFPLFSPLAKEQKVAYQRRRPLSQAHMSCFFATTSVCFVQNVVLGGGRNETDSWKGGQSLTCYILCLHHI